MGLSTSYFAQLKNISNPLSICCGPPAWYYGNEFKVLAPKYDFFIKYKRGELSEAGYVEQFQEKVLNPLNPQEIYDKITSKFGDDATLICYEKPGDFCHRHIVALWLESSLGIIVPELSFEKSGGIIEFP